LVGPHADDVDLIGGGWGVSILLCVPCGPYVPSHRRGASTCPLHTPGIALCTNSKLP
jgi:hypothetical protein